MASARLGRMFSCLRSVSVSQRTSLRLLADSGRMSVTAPEAVARARPFFLFGRASAELRFVRRVVLPADFMVSHPSFDLSVKVHGEHRYFGERTVVFLRQMVAVVGRMPTLVLRPAAVLDMPRHCLFALDPRLHGIVGADEIGVFLRLQERPILLPVFRVVDALEHALHGLRDMIAPGEARAPPTTEQAMPAGPGSSNGAGRLVRFLS